jgi:sulfonate transport system ATP-binding protein
MDKDVKIRIEHLNKAFPVNDTQMEVLRDISLKVYAGEFVSIVGYSGCGKSTLLRIIGGMESKDSGLLQMNDKDITAPGLDRGMIFQEARLFPWMRVKDNIAYGISKEMLKKLGKKKKDELVKQYIELVELNGFENAYPYQLSGGMQQRVSIARSLIENPEVLLLDEPLGALDAITRMNMQKEIMKIWKLADMTMILVTHDIDEAIFLSDKIIVLSSRPGTIKKVFHNSLPRPRKRTSIEFIEMRQAIFREFFEDDDNMEDYMI